MFVKSCPVLPALSAPVPERYTPFVRRVQAALQAVGLPLLPSGIWDQASGDALGAFIRNTGAGPSEELAGLLGYSFADCTTYRALGLDCERAFADPQILGGADARQVESLGREGWIELRCVALPRGVFYLTVAGTVAGLAGLFWAGSKQEVAP
ncbi:MAG: hypothetical protein PHZ19_09715 [Candidatus Thermoplasmatota archaeon]|nr:hypothetical protein [Candidatus Thermoplasmatota archaeon]